MRTETGLRSSLLPFHPGIKCKFSQKLLWDQASPGSSGRAPASLQHVCQVGEAVPLTLRARKRPCHPGCSLPVAQTPTLPPPSWTSAASCPAEPCWHRSVCKAYSAVVTFPPWATAVQVPPHC